MRYTACRKGVLVATSKHLQAEGRLMRNAVSELRISATNLWRWALQGIGQIDHLDKILRSKKNAVLTGPVSRGFSPATILSHESKKNPS